MKTSPRSPLIAQRLSIIVKSIRCSSVYSRSILPLGIFAAIALSPSALAQSLWAGTAGNWSSNGNPGWNGTGVPNAVGASAGATANTTANITQDIGAGVTVGTLTRGGAGNFGLLVDLTNSLTLNQDGAGAGFATISNTNSNAGTTNRIVISGASNLILADDLLISNTGGNTTANGSIQLQSVISGTGNITINNVANTISTPSSNAGAIRFQGVANTFVGNVLVQKGAVTYNDSASFGNSANVITLGQSGQGSASLVGTSAGTDVANNIVVAASTGGTTVLGSVSTAAGSTTHSGTILLNGDLTVISSQTGAGAVALTNEISGVGNLSTGGGTGAVRLSGTNTYTGNTTVNAGTGALTLSDNAKLTFDIGSSGVNNQINGAGNLTLDGDFIFDLTGAAAVGSWNIVNVGTLTETFASTFTVVGFTDAGSNTWTRVIGPSTYTFSEVTGLLTAVPEPATWVLLTSGLTLMVTLRRRRSSVGSMN